MSQESNDEMRPEYDIRGGVRGKYRARYLAAMKITFDSPFIALSTASTPLVGAITRATSYQPPPSSTIRIGPVAVNAGEDTPR